jgi:hypothetical protein
MCEREKESEEKGMGKIRSEREKKRKRRRKRERERENGKEKRRKRSAQISDPRTWVLFSFLSLPTCMNRFVRRQGGKTRGKNYKDDSRSRKVKGRKISLLMLFTS